MIIRRMFLFLRFFCFDCYIYFNFFYGVLFIIYVYVVILGDDIWVGIWEDRMYG